MAIKIMRKNYHLINRTTSAKMTVFPYLYLGAHKDHKKKLNSDGCRLRVFKVVDANGTDISGFDRPDGVESDEFITIQSRGVFPHVVLNGETWDITLIEGIVAKKPRKAKSTVAATPVADADVEATKATTTV